MKQIVIYDVVCNACVQSVRTNINTWIKSTFFFVFPSFLGRHFLYMGDVTEDRRLIIVCLIFWKKNEVPDTLNGFLVKYEDATIIIPDSTLHETQSS